jgi:hypothetical protein
MKINIITTIFIILSLIASNKIFAADVLSHENFDLYKINDESLLLFDCEIDGVAECEYSDALPMGKKSSYPNAVYIGTGRLNYTKIDIRADVRAKEQTQKRITVFRLINNELDKSLAKGISIIKELLPEDVCSDHQKKNLDFEKMLTKLKAKIKEKRRKKEKTKDVLRGQELLEKLQCY